MSSNFRYQSFVVVSENLGGKVPVVDDVLSSHEQEIYPTTSLDENCRVWTSNGSKLLRWFETDVLGFETENSQGSWLRNLQYQRSKKEHKEEAKAEEEKTAEEEAPVPLVNHVNNI